MADNFMTVQVTGLDEMQKAFKKSPQIVKDCIDPAIRKAIFTIQANATPHIPNSSGELASQITQFAPFFGSLKSRAPYAMFIHGDGTKDRSEPHFPPLQAIQRWADRHGIPAFLVARSIAKKGTKLIPFYDMGIKESQASIDRYFVSALNQITIKLAS